jgi:hypothetical protein
VKKTRKRTGHGGGKGARQRHPVKHKRIVHSPYVRQLLEENRFFRKQFAFMQGKIERLELAAMTQTPQGRDYVARTEQAQTPPMSEVKGKLTHAEIAKRWGELSAEEQEKYMLEGGWNPEEEKPKARAN